MKDPPAWTELLDVRPSLDTDSLDRYAAELLSWNRVIRLVGPRDIPGVRTQVIDALLPFLHHPPPFPLLDIGSGAGLPAVPLAVVYRTEPIVCLEPRLKRVAFLRHALRTLRLGSVEVLAARTDEVPRLHPERLGGFAAATARAVGGIPSLLAAARPLLRPRGSVYLPRGEEASTPVPGWELILDAPYTPPRGLGPRRLLVYRSTA